MSECGVVVAATGERQIFLARRAAHTLERIEPDLPIDLFADTDPKDPVFDRVHSLLRAMIS